MAIDDLSLFNSSGTNVLSSNVDESIRVQWFHVIGIGKYDFNLCRLPPTDKAPQIFCRFASFSKFKIRASSWSNALLAVPPDAAVWITGIRYGCKAA